MAELRKHPLTNDWIMIASHRQGRPQMPGTTARSVPAPARFRNSSTSINMITIFRRCRRTPRAGSGCHRFL